MSSVAVIIPVKSKDPKSRLANILDADQRRQLRIAMLEDVLGAVMRAGLIRSTYIVSSDNEVLKFTGRYGATGIHEDENRGVNAAVSAGMEGARERAATMIIPADVPFLDPKDLRNAVTLYRLGSSVVISPSESLDGTNLLMLKRGTHFRFHYDDDSFRKHSRYCIARGIPTSVYYSQSVAFDIDTSRDLYRVFRVGKKSSTLTFLGRVMGRRALKQTPRRDEDQASHREL